MKTIVRKKPALKSKTSLKVVAPSTEEKVADTTTETQNSEGRNEYGLRPDSDVAIVLEEMVKGGADKHEVATRLTKRFENSTTKSGKPKPVSTVMNQVIHAFKERGFTVESTWKFLPPADGVLLPAKKSTKTTSRAKPAAKSVAKKAEVAATATKRTPRKVKPRAGKLASVKPSGATVGTKARVKPRAIARPVKKAA